MIKLKHFDNREDLNANLKKLLIDQMCSDLGCKHAMMLSGGSTPLPIYKELSTLPLTVSENLHIFYSDERIVASDSKDSNYGNSKPMLDNMGIESSKVFRVKTELGLEGAQQQIDNQLKNYLESKGKVSFGLLGLGADGHTASIFNKNDALFQDEYTLSVKNQLGFDRVSVSPKLLANVELIVIAVCGDSKKDIILELINYPKQLPAGLALNDNQNVELWTDIPEVRLFR